MIIAHNFLAMNNQRKLGINTKKKASSSEKLSSGYRINKAADDAAGLDISEKLRKQIKGLGQGVLNTQDGVSLCQVMDGALTEVTDMLQRMTELSVKSANGTNSQSDRNDIQKEINQLLQEIDRVGESTRFNEIAVFKGSKTAAVSRVGNGPATIGGLSFSDFVLADVSLGRTPLSAGGDANSLHLQAIVNKPGSAFNGQTFNLIYGSGSTSNSSFRITNAQGHRTEVALDSLAPSNYVFNGSDTWSKNYVYSSTAASVTVTQKIQVEDTSATEKNYKITYGFAATGDVSKLEFMFHTDTAYNNNDRCEGYFIDGNRVENYCIYSKQGSGLTSNATSNYIHTGVPDSLSIIDVDNALAFSEKVSFAQGQEPDSFSIGHYSYIDDWSYYNSLNTNLGHSTNRADLGFSLYYDLTTPANQEITFNYGIISAETDPNIANVSLTRDSTSPEAMFLKFSRSLWIQSGADSGNGLNITLPEMNAKALGLHGLDVSTEEASLASLGKVDKALKQITDMRSTTGAQQNKLEHIIANENNIIENTTASESKIRDTNMASEMFNMANYNILTQFGQSLSAQANQKNQSVISLLD